MAGGIGGRCRSGSGARAGGICTTSIKILDTDFFGSGD